MNIYGSLMGILTKNRHLRSANKINILDFINVPKKSID